MRHCVPTSLAALEACHRPAGRDRVTHASVVCETGASAATLLLLVCLLFALLWHYKGTMVPVALPTLVRRMHR